RPRWIGLCECWKPHQQNGRNGQYETSRHTILSFRTLAPRGLASCVPARTSLTPTVYRIFASEISPVCVTREGSAVTFVGQNRTRVVEIGGRVCLLRNGKEHKKHNRHKKKPFVLLVLLVLLVFLPLLTGLHYAILQPAPAAPFGSVRARHQLYPI